MMRSWAYNRLGVLMGTSGSVSCPHWHGLRDNSLPMITPFLSQGGFCATAFIMSVGRQLLYGQLGGICAPLLPELTALNGEFCCSLPDDDSADSHCSWLPTGGTLF